MDRFADFFGTFKYYNEAKVTAECETCGCDIKEGEEVYNNPITEEYYCCQDCAIKSIGFVQIVAVESVCEQCGAILSAESESVASCGDVFCDEDCLLQYNEISEVEA
ncbi:hypothetical protein JCM17380_24530 [Desulfosporosinus burensis]